MYLSTMNLTIKPKNRRQFLKKFSLSAAVVAFAPNVTFGKSTIKDKISIGFSNTPSETILKISTHFSLNHQFILTKNHLQADILYIHSGTYNDFKQLEEELLDKTILIVNQANLDAHTVNYLKNICNSNNTFLLEIEENVSESPQILFSKATLYEPFQCNLSKIDTITKSVFYFNQLTRNNNFFTVNSLSSLKQKLV